MMGVVYSKTETGVLVAERSVGREAVATALKRYDRSLRLVPSVDPLHQSVLWKVYVYHGPDRPATFLLAWQSRDGTPLPLSMRLLDMVAAHDRNTRSKAVDEDESNRRLVEGRRAERRAVTQEIGREMAPKIERERAPCFHRGAHLRRRREGG